MSDIFDGFGNDDLTLLGQSDDQTANRLPFASLYAFWRNGQPANKKTGGVAYFGGWAVPASAFDDVGAEPPKGWQKSEYDKQGETVYSYTNRLLSVAPFATRRWWTDKNSGTRYGQPAKGCSPTLQVLAAVKLEKGGTVLPLVLHLTGWQASFYDGAIGEWSKLISKFSREFTQQRVGPFAFWCSLGTAGDTPQTRTVGTGKNTKEINRVSALVPAEMNADKLKARFVGVDVLHQAAEWKRQAADWLAFYKTQKATAPAAPDDHLEAEYEAAASVEDEAF